MTCYFLLKTADFFYSVGLGLGKTDSPQVRFPKSISNERTFSATEDEVLLNKKLGICLVYHYFSFRECRCCHYKLQLISWNLEILYTLNSVGLDCSSLHMHGFSKSFANDYDMLSFWIIKSLIILSYQRMSHAKLYVCSGACWNAVHRHAERGSVWENIDS